MADLFFKADRQLSAAEEEKANEVRRTYRQWRQGDAAGPHADVLDLNHAASVSEQRSSAKMKRTRTFGDRVNQLGMVPASNKSSHRNSPVPGGQARHARRQHAPHPPGPGVCAEQAQGRSARQGSSRATAAAGPSAGRGWGGASRGARGV